MPQNHVDKKKVNVTFSLPSELNTALHAFVERRHLSRYVTEAIRKALDEDQRSLRQAYMEMSSDPQELEEMGDWGVLDGELWDD